MGVYIDGLDIPKPIKGIKTCYDIIIKSDGSVEEFDSDDRNEYKAEEIYLVRCGECKWWNEETHGCNRNPSVNAWLETDFCSYGERK